MSAPRPRHPRRRPLHCLALCALLSCSSSARDAAPAAPPAPVEISVRGDNGQVIGTLTNSESPPRLIFIATQGQQMELGQCHDEVRHQALGGSGRTARVEVRNCGATVDFATRVLVYGTEGDMLVAVFAGQPDTRLAWTDPDTLVVHQERLVDERLFVRREHVGSVSVRYVVDRRTTLATPDDALDSANLNFAVSGRAAHLPAELLQRIAGWSQQASGLYQPGWGTWSGDPPFGDDPRGHAQVLAGIARFEEQAGGS